MIDPRIFLAATVLLPACAFVAMAAAWIAEIPLRERTTSRLADATYGLALFSLFGLFAGLWSTDASALTIDAGHLYAVHGARMPVTLVLDSLSLPLVAMAVMLIGLIAFVSRRYLHRDPHFNRFYLLLHLFGFGALVLFTAGSFDLMIAGWELVGIASVLMIAFFQERREPVESSIRAFTVYQFCDIGLIAGVCALHAGAGATVVGLLFLFAAMGRSALAPFSGWLPRAMDGPAPSSAIFFGAISIHAGAYLLLRAQAVLDASAAATAAVIAIGAWSAIHGTMVARVCADARTSIAYAAVSQLGLIFVEIGLGWTRLALFHILGHAVMRSYQLLKASSLLEEHRQVHAASGGDLGKTGEHYERLLPAALQARLYRMALDNGHHDTWIDRFVAGPVRKIAARMHALEKRAHG